MSNFRRDIRLARKNVFYDFRAFVWFFFAMFIIESFLSCATLSALNGKNAAYKSAEKNFDYHIAVKNANLAQYDLLANDLAAKYESVKYYDVVRCAAQDENLPSGSRCDIYIRFRGDVLSSYSRFTRSFNDSLRQYDPKGNWYIYKSPLLTVLSGGAGDAVGGVLFIAAASVLCVFFLRTMYGIRTTGFKFSYGVFMTCGGGFGKIYSSSFYEMTLIALITFIPSSVVSCTALKIIYSAAGFAFSASGWGFIISLGLTLIVSCVSLYTPCKKVSRRTPVQNLTAEDNSDYAKSPRRSFEFWRVKIPLKYELASLFRFRKYYIVLVAVCTLFASVYALSRCVSELYLEKIALPEYDCVICFDTSEPDGEGKNEAEENGQTVDRYYDLEADRSVGTIEGIKYIHKVYETRAGDILSHVAVDTDAVSGAVDTIKTPDGREEVFNDAVYLPYSDAEIAYLSGYSYDGDLNSAINNGEILICDTLYGKRSFEILPGDTIKIAVFDTQRRYIDPSLTGTDLLKRQLKACDFTYMEYKVGAVIHDMPCGGEMKIFIPEDEYRPLCGLDEIVYRRVEIGYLDEIDSDQADRLEARISGALAGYGNAKISGVHSSAELESELSRNIYALLRITSVILLLAVPVMWIFSQMTFCYKRGKEFSVLEYIGLGKKTVFKLLTVDSLVTGAIGAALYTIISLAGCSALRYLANRFLTAGGRITYYSAAKPAMIFCGVCVLMISAFAGSAAAYHNYKRNIGPKDRLNVNVEFGE